MAAWLIAMAWIVPPAYADQVSDRDRDRAYDLKAAIPSLQHEAAEGNYASAAKLAKVYLNGVSYAEETLRSRLLPNLPLVSGAGGGRIYRDHVLLDPEPAKLKTLLEGLAAKGDVWAMLKLAELHSRPAPTSLDDGWVMLNPKAAPGPATREIEQIFPSDPDLSLRLYAEAAEPAANIIRDSAMAVYTNNHAVPVAQQKDFLFQQHEAVAWALKDLADWHAQTPLSQDWVAARAEYQRLAALVASPSFTVNAPYPAFEDAPYPLATFLSFREEALLQAAELQAQGGHGLAVDCPAALRELRSHAVDFPDPFTRQLSRQMRAEIFGKLQSAIGLIYYHGCPGQKADRAEAFAWLYRTNAGGHPLKREYGESDIEPRDNKFNLTPAALVALADLLDRGAPGVAPRPREAFDTLWIAEPSGPVLLRTAQMIEEGSKYTDIEAERANLFYCRAADEFAEPHARLWLQAHPKVECHAR